MGARLDPKRAPIALAGDVPGENAARPSAASHTRRRPAPNGAFEPCQPVPAR